MAKAKPIDEKTIDSPTLWLKASSRTRHNRNFLNATRRILEQWEGEKAKAVFIQLDYGKIDSGTAIQILYQIVMVGKLDRQLEKTAEQEAKKNWIVSIIGDPTAVNDQVVVLRQAFESEKEARGFCDRYLFNHAASSWYGMIESKTEKTTYRVERLDSFARLNPKPVKAATVPIVKVSASRLSFDVGGQYNRPYYTSRG